MLTVINFVGVWVFVVLTLSSAQISFLLRYLRVPRLALDWQ
jgi:hypothetical protein